MVSPRDTSLISGETSWLTETCGKFMSRASLATRRSYTDRKVRRRTTYGYRIVLVANGVLSLPSKTIVVRVH